MIALEAEDGVADILLIHGMGCGGDVWTKLLILLRTAGWRCSAPTLCAEDRPVTRPTEGQPSSSFADQVDDARMLCSQIHLNTGRAPIVIGHSMGGLIAQVLASEGLCRAAVLVTPAPPRGIPNNSPWVVFLYANVLISRRLDRWHKAWRLGVNTVLLNRARRGKIYDRMRYEPGQTFADMMAGVAVDPMARRCPLLVVSAGRDRVVPSAVVDRIVRFHCVAPAPCEHVNFRENGHWIIDEPGNGAFISTLLAWLGEHRC